MKQFIRDIDFDDEFDDVIDAQVSAFDDVIDIWVSAVLSCFLYI